jgi:hypothetical protein
MSTFLIKKDTLNVSLAGTECRELLVVEHTANMRKNTKISAIWHHGGERQRLDDHSMERYWRCAYCKGSATILKVTGGNGGQAAYALTHLKNKTSGRLQRR